VTAPRILSRTEGEHLETIRKPVSGWWAVYRLSQACGGSEEGGWWYDCGELVAAFPGERAADHEYRTETFLTKLQLADGSELDQYESGETSLDSVRYVSHEKPQHVVAMLGKLVEDGQGIFDDGEYTSTRPRHETLTCRWVTTLALSFPSEVPSYE